MGDQYAQMDKHAVQGPAATAGRNDGNGPVIGMVATIVMLSLGLTSYLAVTNVPAYPAVRVVASCDFNRTGEVVSGAGQKYCDQKHNCTHELKNLKGQPRVSHVISRYARVGTQVGYRTYYGNTLNASGTAKMHKCNHSKNAVIAGEHGAKIGVVKTDWKDGAGSQCHAGEPAEGTFKMGMQGVDGLVYTCFQKVVLRGNAATRATVDLVVLDKGWHEKDDMMRAWVRVGNKVELTMLPDCKFNMTRDNMRNTYVIIAPTKYLVPDSAKRAAMVASIQKQIAVNKDGTLAKKHSIPAVAGKLDMGATQVVISQVLSGDIKHFRAILNQYSLGNYTDWKVGGDNIGLINETEHFTSLQSRCTQTQLSVDLTGYDTAQVCIGMQSGMGHETIWIKKMAITQGGPEFHEVDPRFRRCEPLTEQKYEETSCTTVAEEKERKTEKKKELNQGNGLAVFFLVVSLLFTGLGVASKVLKWGAVEGPHGVDAGLMG